MNVLRAILSILLSLASISWAAEQNVHAELDRPDPAALQEATRVLEEEIKLAARPQTYVLIDLAANAILIKGRGVELHRIPIESWSASHLSQLASRYRLHERPPVNRRKIDPAAGAEQDPISLADMPTTFTLRILPPVERSSSSRILMAIPGNGPSQRGRMWWNRVTSWGITLWTGDKTPVSPIPGSHRLSRPCAISRLDGHGGHALSHPSTHDALESSLMFVFLSSDIYNGRKACHEVDTNRSLLLGTSMPWSLRRTNDSPHPMRSTDSGLAIIDSGNKIPPTSPTASAG